jgi:hypothetical protein
MEKVNEKTKQQEQQKQNEISETKQEINELKQVQGSNEYDERIIKHIVDGNVKKHATKEARLLEIEKLEIENNKEFQRIAEENKKLQIEYEHKAEIMKIVFDGVKWIVVSAAAVATAYVVTQKDIEIEKINQGL